MRKILSLLPNEPDVNYRIKEVAKRKGMTLAELAQSIDKTPNYLSRIINGRTSPNTKLINKIAYALDVNVIELLEAPKGYEHIYNDEGAWRGLLPNPCIE